MILIYYCQLTERETSPGIEGLNLSYFERPMAPENEIQSFRYVISFSVTHSICLHIYNSQTQLPCHSFLFRVFVGTWNVGGKSPSYDLNLQDFLLVEGSADIYVLGYDSIHKFTKAQLCLKIHVLCICKCNCFYEFVFIQIIITT